MNLLKLKYLYILLEKIVGNIVEKSKEKLQTFHHQFQTSKSIVGVLKG